MKEKEIRQQYRQKKCELKRTFRTEKRFLKQTYKTQRQEERQNVPLSLSDPPKRSTLEEIGNAITHGVGALFAVVAYVLMLLASDTPIDKIAATVYFFGLFTMFAMSCLYHSFRHGSKVKRLFRRFDYSSIYLLIGATFAPLLLCYVGGAFGTAFLIVQWAIIATGITFIGVFGPTKWKKLHMTLYVLLGWSALLFIPQMLSADLAFFLFILLGGVLYSLGIIPFAMKKGCTHFIWHFFVLGGAIVQWLGIYFYLYL